MESKGILIIRLGRGRRIKIYAEGGYAEEVHVEGIGWCVSTEAEWPETTPAIRAWVGRLAALAGQLETAELDAGWPSGEVRLTPVQSVPVFDESEVGGAFDGFSVTSDADPGL